MQVTAAQVKDLREQTGAGMLDCKNALVETEGDIKKAIDLLRERGLGKAAKKVDRLAAEGVVTLLLDKEKNSATLTEINSETDFVAKNQTFQNLANRVTKHIFDEDVKIESLYETTIDGESFETFLKGQIAQIGENLVVRRAVTFKGTDDTLVHGYLHFNSKVGTIIEVSSSFKDKDKVREFANSICMHISAMNPKFLDTSEMSEEFIDLEFKALVANIEKENEEAVRLGKHVKKIPVYGTKSQLTEEVLNKAKKDFEEELKKQGKPEKIWDKILPGLIQRFIADNTQIDQTYCLYAQPFILDEDKSVLEVIEQKEKEWGESFKILRYARLEVGEGIEKQESDFAKEVAEQLKR